jgi:hypothetical protein
VEEEYCEETCNLMRENLGVFIHFRISKSEKWALKRKRHKIGKSLSDQQVPQNHHIKLPITE